LGILGTSGIVSFSDCGCGDCLSGKIDPSRAATLPLLLTGSFFSFTGVEALDFRSGLELALVVVWRGMKASFSLPTGEDDRFSFSSLGARRDAVVIAGEEAEGVWEEGRTGVFVGELVALNGSTAATS
jgi:hypothetical protein